MRVVHASDVEWAPLSGHRGGTILFKRLLEGSRGDPGNFELSLARADGDYFTPRHRHNFDQIRVALEGSFNFATKRDLAEGTVGYFPEGTFYGPQEARERSVILLLQFGGASGDGFMSYDELEAGFAWILQLEAPTANAWWRLKAETWVPAADRLLTELARLLPPGPSLEA